MEINFNRLGGSWGAQRESGQAGGCDSGLQVLADQFPPLFPRALALPSRWGAEPISLSLLECPNCASSAHPS